MHNFQSRLTAPNPVRHPFFCTVVPRILGDGAALILANSTFSFKSTLNIPQWSPALTPSLVLKPFAPADITVITMN